MLQAYCLQLSLLLSQVLGDPGGGFLQRLLLFGFNSCLTLGRHLARFLVGHSEHIIGLHSAVGTAVAGDRLAKLLHFFVLGHLLDAEEHIRGGVN